MVSFVTSALGLIFVITLIVLFHEAGHYTTARMAGVAVTEFAIGMGKRVWGFRRGSTDYNLRLIPIGGFVDLVGMEENPEATPEEREQEFAGKSAAWRIVILFAGSFMNFVLAFLLFALVNGFFGQAVQPLASSTVLYKIAPGSPAERAGLLPGDELLALDGAPVASWPAFRAAIESRPGRQTEVKVRRGGTELAITVLPETNPASPAKGRIGVMAGQAPVLGEIHPDSPAARAGLLAGDRLVAIGGKPARIFEDLQDALETAAKGDGVVALTVGRPTGEVEVKIEAPLPEIGVRPPYAAVIGGTNPGDPAERAGFLPGDRVVSIAGTPVLSWHHMVSLLAVSEGRTLEVALESETGAARTVAVKPREAGKGVYVLGVSIKTEYEEPLGVVKGTVVAWHQTVEITEKTIQGIWKLIVGALSLDNVSGPVGIAKIVGSQAREGFVALLGVTALLSINIGLINLFPIPGLDGSRILFVAIEILRRRKVSARVEEAIHAAGLTLLILLLLLVTWKDVMKLF